MVFDTLRRKSKTERTLWNPNNISHITLIGSPNSSKSDIGMLLRAGTAGSISNAIVVGFNDSCVQVDNQPTIDNAYKDSKATGELMLSNSIISCKKNLKTPSSGTLPFPEADFFKTLGADIRLTDPMLGAPYDLRKPNFVPKAGSPALSGAKTINDAFFQNVSFVGGVDPKDDWTKGWTTADAK